MHLRLFVSLSTARMGDEASEAVQKAKSVLAAAGKHLLIVCYRSA